MHYIRELLQISVGMQTVQQILNSASQNNSAKNMPIYFLNLTSLLSHPHRNSLEMPEQILQKEQITTKIHPFYD